MSQYYLYFRINISPYIFIFWCGCIILRGILKKRGKEIHIKINKSGENNRMCDALLRAFINWSKLKRIPLHAWDNHQEVSLASKLISEGSKWQKCRDFTTKKGEKTEEEWPTITVSHWFTGLTLKKRKVKWGSFPLQLNVTKSLRVLAFT